MKKWETYEDVEKRLSGYKPPLWGRIAEAVGLGILLILFLFGHFGWLIELLT